MGIITGLCIAQDAKARGISNHDLVKVHNHKALLSVLPI